MPRRERLWRDARARTGAAASRVPPAPLPSASFASLNAAPCGRNTLSGRRVGHAMVTHRQRRFLEASSKTAKGPIIDPSRFSHESQPPIYGIAARRFCGKCERRPRRLALCARCGIGSNRDSVLSFRPRQLFLLPFRFPRAGGRRCVPPDRRAIGTCCFARKTKN